MLRHIMVEHPGIILLEEFLKPLHIKPGTLARRIGTDRVAIKKIVEGHRSITAEMAVRLSLFFGNSDTFWLNLQKDYDLRAARRDRLPYFKKIVDPLKTA